MTTTTYYTPDIECDGCANAIKKALSKVSGLSEVQVDVAAKTVTVGYDATTLPATQITDALDRAGFPATTTP